VLLAELVIETRADRGAVLRRHDGLAERDRVERGGEDGGVDDLVVVDVAPGHVHEERCPLGEGPAQVRVPLAALIGRPVRGERVARVERLVHELELGAAAQAVGPGLGEDLDAPEPQPVVLGGKGVRVEADLADRLLGRHAPAGEAVDEELAAAGAGGGTGQGLQRFRQVVGVVGQRLEVVALEDDGPRALAGVEAEGRLALHRRGLLDGRQLERHVECGGRAGGHRDVVLRERRKPRAGHHDQVRTRR
jgi:hypothetical protein